VLGLFERNKEDITSVVPLIHLMLAHTEFWEEHKKLCVYGGVRQGIYKPPRVKKVWTNWAPFQSSRDYILPKPVWSMYTINILYMIFHVRITQNDDAAELRSKLKPELALNYKYFE
jgi:hypothetical protein